MEAALARMRDVLRWAYPFVAANAWPALGQAFNDVVTQAVFLARRNGALERRANALERQLAAARGASAGRVFARRRRARSVPLETPQFGPEHALPRPLTLPAPTAGAAVQWCCDGIWMTVRVLGEPRTLHSRKRGNTYRVRDPFTRVARDVRFTLDNYGDAWRMFNQA